eukprot:CAMPEP_0169206828 /NCGR_PEP_ID=MMETSP1016-20121227/13253_1 /TAXON_ID=342587 /ORGANISM="Karlodinium micrum, Strain CCMP2283" /LENGTH=56 /DNA_ID=CAMNT_0009284055 /DNA_START=307 /DNA_END=477 /DNA_ORIENTATION=+
MTINHEATAIDAHDVATDRRLSDDDVHNTLAAEKLILVKHEACRFPLVRMELAEQD